MKAQLGEEAMAQAPGWCILFGADGRPSCSLPGPAPGPSCEGFERLGTLFFPVPGMSKSMHGPNRRAVAWCVGAWVENRLLGGAEATDRDPAPDRIGVSMNSLEVQGISGMAHNYLLEGPGRRSIPCTWHADGHG